MRGEGPLQGQLSKYGRTQKERSKGKALTSVITWDDSSSEDEPPRARSHRSSSRSSRSSHKCLMARGNKTFHPLAMKIAVMMKVRESPP
jgi:hypothetical protein